MSDNKADWNRKLSGFLYCHIFGSDFEVIRFLISIVFVRSARRGGSNELLFVISDFFRIFKSSLTIKKKKSRLWDRDFFGEIPQEATSNCVPEQGSFVPMVPKPGICGGSRWRGSPRSPWAPAPSPWNRGALGVCRADCAPRSTLSSRRASSSACSSGGSHENWWNCERASTGRGDAEKFFKIQINVRGSYLKSDLLVKFW